jgi:hypothetical protein
MKDSTLATPAANERALMAAAPFSLRHRGFCLDLHTSYNDESIIELEWWYKSDWGVVQYRAL